MRTILDYLKENECKMDTPNEVDALILGQLSYLNFENLIKNKRTYLLSKYKNNSDELCTDTLFPNKNKELLEAILTSPRFNNLKIAYLESTLNKDVQFCAMTFICNNHYFIVFRGTDLSVAGWIEDLNMSINEAIPSYNMAIKYISNIIEKNQKNVYVIGHSKGGSIAVYGSIMLDKKYQDKLAGVYNFDGPGFKENLFKNEKYFNIRDKIYKYIPQNDVVGVLLNNSEKYQIIKSSSVGIMQHNSYSWILDENDKFITLSKTNVTSRFFQSITNTIINRITDEEKEELIIAIAKSFENANIHSLLEFRRHFFKAIKSLLLPKNLSLIENMQSSKIIT